MARGINKVILVATLGKDPEVRYAQNGNAVASFSVATSESWNDKQTSQKVEKTEWHNISVFGKLAEICGQYLKKGSKVYLEGKLSTEKWQDKSGSDRYTTKVIVNEMQMLDSRGDSRHEAQPQNRDIPAPNRSPHASQPLPEPVTAPDDFDDDIPFDLYMRGMI